MITVLCDLDGPILDGRNRHYAVYRGILEEYGFEPLPIETYWERKRNLVNRRDMLASSNAVEIYDTFLRLWMERIEQPEYLAFDRVQPGARETLATWRSAGNRICLVTLRHNAPGLHEQLERIDMIGVFDLVLPCEHARGGVGKADAVRDALPDVTPDDAVWIGDTEADIEAARAFGCRVWALTCGLRTEEFLANLRPDFIAAELRDAEIERVPANTHLGA